MGARHNPRPILKRIPPDKVERLLKKDMTHIWPLSEGALEAKQLLAVAEIEFIKQKEKVMPDMQTAMSAALRAANLKATVAAWDDEDETPIKETVSLSTTKDTTMKPINSTQPRNISKTAFEYIRDNPNINMNKALAALAAEGMNPATIRSNYSQMFRQKLIERDANDCLRALVPSYIPLTSTNKMAQLKRQAAVDELKRLQQAERVRVRALRQGTVEGIAALKAPEAEPTPAPVQTWTTAPSPTPTAAPILTAAQVLETLSVKEAFALYRELQNMFDKS